MKIVAPISLLITDDHQLIIDGISGILQSEKIIYKIFTAKNGAEAIEKVNTEPIDCVLMDVNMPNINGYEATKMIKKLQPSIRIIVVSMSCDATIVSRMLKAGADAFINKETGKAELLLAISKVMQGEKYISPDISATLFTQLIDQDINADASKAQLTKRETEIIRLIADGLTNIEIARKLFLSAVTVNTHRKNMLAKLKLKNTAALVKYAVINNLL